MGSLFKGGGIAKLFGKSRAASQKAAAGSQPLTGIDPNVDRSQLPAPPGSLDGTTEGRVRRGRGRGLGGPKKSLAASTVLSSTY